MEGSGVGIALGVYMVLGAYILHVDVHGIMLSMAAT